jgi:hypothetical protein
VKKKKIGPICKELKNFLPKKLSLSFQKCRFGIRDTHPGSGKKTIADPGSWVKKAPDSGSGSATLHKKEKVPETVRIPGLVYVHETANLARSEGDVLIP